MIGIVTTAIDTARHIAAIKPVSLSVVHYSSSLELKGRTWRFISGIFLVDKGTVVLLFDALDAVKPRTGSAKIKSEYLCDLLLRVCVKKLIGD
jgi:hypothetical protein